VSKGRYRSENPDLLDYVKDLEKRISALERTPQLANSSVDAGHLTVQATGGFRVLHDNGVTMLEAARIDTGFGPVEQVVYHRRNGTISLQVASNVFGFEFVRVLDALGFIIFSDDGLTGEGLGVPYLNNGFVSLAATPVDSTSSGTFTALQRSVWRKQQPMIQFRVRHNVTATTGEIRFRISSGTYTGIILGDLPNVFTLAAGSGQTTFGPFRMVGNHLDEIEIDVEARVASGAGSVAVCVMSALGRGS